MKLVDPNLEQTYASIRDEKKREAAEIAYALGLQYKATGDFEKMKQFRDESVALFKAVGINTLDGAAPIYETINGTIMPNLIHEGVVERDLADVVPNT